MTTATGLRGLRTVRTAVILALTLTVILAQAAAGAWLISSLPGSAAAKGLTLPPVTEVTAGIGGQAATVTWHAAALPAGAGPVTYQVLAYPTGTGPARTPGGTCAGTGGLVTTTTCQDTSVPDGTWVYRVRVRVGSWTGPAGEAGAVTVDGPDPGPGPGPGTDTTNPTLSSTVPASGATGVPLTGDISATFNEAVAPATVTGTTFTLARTAGGPDVTATVSSSGPVATLTPGSPLAPSTQYTATLRGGATGITDLSGNPLVADRTWSFTTAASPEVTLFGDTTPSLVTDFNDYELGVRFSSSSDGVVTGIRFYKGAQNTGLHTGRLWNATTQELLGTVTFTDETPTGWQTALFATALPIQAGTTYIASYTAPVGNYAYQANYFTDSAHTAGPLTALQSTPGARNGVLSEVPGQFPTSSFNDSNYFVDVAFRAGPDTTRPTVTGRSPAPAATGVSTAATVSATLSEPVKASTVTGSSFTLTRGGAPVPATVSSSGGSVTLTPASALERETQYTATLTGGPGGITDVAGNPLAADVTWTFTTAGTTSTVVTIFGDAVGGSAQGPDGGQSIEAGVKFRVSQAGFVSAIRFFKPFAAGGAYTGRLYTAAGVLLGEGTVTLPADATGWQELPLSTPVTLTPDTTYVASYFSPTGQYAYTAGGLLDAGVTNGPVTALRSGVDGPNGVYNLGGGFPSSSASTPANYWADVVFDTGPLPADASPPVVTTRSPAPGATGVSSGTAVTVGFNEVIAPASVTGSSVALTGPDGDIAATVGAAGSILTLTPAAALAPGSSYSVRVSGGTDGVKDLAGNALATDDTWVFTTRSEAAPRPDPADGPGGPVLVVPGTGGFGGYLAEILRGEGLNLFTVGGTGNLSASGLADYTMVVLGATDLTAGQTDALTAWVLEGGDLVALRPDARLNGLLGLTGPSGTLSEGYLKVDTDNGPGRGIVGQTMQFHGTADRYDAAAGTTVVATLFSTATSATANPAVTVRKVGTAGGSASAFTYDLARSVVLTRQGNPGWVDQNRDGQPGPHRSNDLFFGAMAGDAQPDYVDLGKVAIPQADEQQRLLANVMSQASLDAQPLPRFWYLPRGEKAAVVMTADQHDAGSVAERFDREIGSSPAGCSVEDWECVRSTSYLYPTQPALTAAQASSYEGQGFEIALHPNTGCQNQSGAQYADTLAGQLAALAAKYPTLQPSSTSRNHCIAWIDYTTVPEELEKQGVHLDTNYYFWPSGWVNNVPGLFTGSGFAQRFATANGQLVDVYQATTQMTDESDQSYPSTIAALLDSALGAEGYYGTFVANIHSDGGTENLNTSIISAAQARGVPVISARQLLTWTDGRNASSFDDLGWDAATGKLTFRVDVGAGARGLQSMIPLTAGGELQSLVGPGGAVAPTTRVVKGVSYAAFPAQAGAWTATYALPEADSTPPAVDSTVPADGADGVNPLTSVKAVFSEAVDPTTVSSATFTLETSDGSPVPGAVSYQAASRTVTFAPASTLAVATAHTATLTPGIEDLAGNPMAAPVTWSFTTAAAPPPPDAPQVSDTSEADFGEGANDGTSVRADGGGAVALRTTTERLEFDAATYPAGWSPRSTPWSTGGTAAVDGGALAVDGTAVFGPSGRYAAVEATATFGAEAFQNVGLAGDTDFGAPWFAFSTGSGTTQVFARSSAGVEVGLGAGLVGSQHTYRIEWAPNEVRWYVDGTLRHTASASAAGPLRPVLSDFTTGGPGLGVASIETAQYGGDGTFTSHVFDAGETSAWGAVNSDADVPAGTTLAVQVRTGPTPTPDGSWSAFITVAAGAVPPSPPARYLQYRVVLTSADPRSTPLLRSVTIGGL